MFYIKIRFSIQTLEKDFYLKKYVILYLSLNLLLLRK